MNALLDLIPAVVFFAVYRFTHDFFAATASLIVVTLGQTALMWLRTRKIAKMQLVTVIAVVVFGGMTLAFHDAEFLKWKLTVIYGALAAALLASHVIGHKVLLARLPQEAIRLPDIVWRRVNFAWAVFFAACAALNWYIACHFSEDTWVSFKAWGMPALTVAFTLLHLPFLARYLDDAPQEPAAGRALDKPG